MSVVGSNDPEATSISVPVEPDKLKALKIYVRQPPEFVDGHSQHFSFSIEDRASFEEDHYKATFNAPDTKK